jgi:hypothetical protein
MVGNDPDRDLAPAHRLGLKTFFVDGQAAADAEYAAGRGPLGELRPWLESIDLSALEPSFKSREAVLAIMASTTAVLHGLSVPLTDDRWRHEPTREEWAMNEIVCHLRDTEREIHQDQLNLMVARESAFIPRPDSGVWANEREYRNVDGRLALREFAQARIDTLKILKGLDESIWQRSAQNAPKCVRLTRPIPEGRVITA